MFQTEATSVEEFSNWDDLMAWASREARSVSYISGHSILKEDTRIVGDRYLDSPASNVVLANKGLWLVFTDKGLRAFCDKLRLPPHIPTTIKEKGLASEVLTDLLNNDSTKARLSNAMFVVDRVAGSEPYGKICGIVSNKYVRYSNHEFLQDIRGLIDGKNSSSGDLALEEAYSINTKLYLRLTSTHISGVVRNKHTKRSNSKDITKVGLEFRNSMVGDTAVSINHFLHRLVCSNGLILPAGRNMEKIAHWGRDKDFSHLLHRAFKNALAELKEKAAYVKQLNEIEFSPEKLAEMKLSDMIFGIIPGSKSTIISENQSIFKEFRFRKLSVEDKIEREALAIEHLPKHYAGKLSGAVFNSPYRSNASIFDLINVFTEYANDVPAEDRIGIQTRAGEFAEWAIKNKKSLL